MAKTIKLRIPKRVNEQVANQLLEMAIPLKSYKERVDGVRLQLVDNWCLCKYCQTYDLQNRNYNHWITELRAHMDNIKSLNIKQGDKLKTLKKMLIDDYDFDDVETIYRIIIGKFQREKITNVNIISSVCNEFANSIESFVNALGVDSIITDNYLNNTFDLQD